MAKIHLAREGDFAGHQITNAACGQVRGFGSETQENECVGPQQESQITCRKCKRILWDRIVGVKSKKEIL